ncbi:hypothetical protein BH24BAC1_BH24BAC1_09070 [soil metagenome]
MDTLLIQLTNQRAYKLLLELEELDLIRVLKRNVQQDIKLSDTFAGKLPANIADDLQKHVAQSRNEWDSPTS